MVTIPNFFKDKYNKYQIRKDASYILRISNPSDELQVLSVKKDPKIISKLANPCNAVYELLGNKHTELLHNIGVLPESIQYSLITKNPKVFPLLESPTLGTLDTVLQQMPSVIKGVSLTKEQQDYVYIQKPSAFEYITSPHESLQLQVIEKDEFSFLQIDLPTKEATSSVLKKSIGATTENISPKIIDSTRSLIRKFSIAQHEFSKEGEKESTVLANSKLHDAYYQAIEDFRNETGLLPNSKVFTEATKEKINNKNFQIQKEVIVQFEKQYSDTIQKEVSSELQRLGIPSSPLQPKDISDLSNGKGVKIPGGTILQRVKTPTGYAMKAYSFVNNMTRTGQAEM